MSSYREHHYYRTRVPKKKSCCGCEGGSSANSDVDLSGLTARLAEAERKIAELQEENKQQAETIAKMRQASKDEAVETILNQLVDIKNLAGETTHRAFPASGSVNTKTESTDTSGYTEPQPPSDT